MATPAAPDTKTLKGATEDLEEGGLFNTTSGTVAVGIRSSVAADLTAAEAAKDAAKAAQTAAETAKTAAETAETNAETAETNAETAETNAEAARDTALAYRNTAQEHRDDAKKLATNAEDSQYTLADGSTTGYSALHYQAKAEDEKTLAETAKTQAVTAKNDAVTAKNDAVTAKNDAVTAKNDAVTAKNDAETAKIAAETAYDNFDDTYLGEKSANPTLDNDGDALQTGALYFNNQNNRLFAYDGSNWISATPELVGDTSPQLGGNLDVNGNSIVSVSNGNISITPNGTGKVIVDGLSHPTSDGSNGQFLKTDGSGNLNFANADVVNDTTPQLGGNLDVNNNTIVSTSNGNIDITPHGTGEVNISKVDIDAGAIDGTTIGATTASTGAFTTLTTTGNATIGGDLTVNGTQTTLNTATLTVDDLNITVADGAANAAAANGAGLTVDGASATLTYQSAGDNWNFNKNLDVTGTLSFDGGSTSADLAFGDNDKAKFGAADDIQVYWDATDGHIDVLGTLNINGSGETMAKFVDDGAVELYYDNSKKFETVSGSATVTGTMTATAFSGDGSALTNVPETGDGGIAMAIALG
jgi:hypothetical protein